MLAYSKSSSQNQKVVLAEPIETTMSVENLSYANIAELQPELLNISSTNPYQLDFLVCQICKMFAIAPRQCCICKALTCAECANRMENPHSCVHCPIFGADKTGRLGPPNEITDREKRILDLVRFDCPRECGIVEMGFDELIDHHFNKCDIRPLETKADLLKQQRKL